ncbi:MAG: hypothetical protein HY076_04980, partial [Candidatus Eisenbacteria bacterium]|nr:hypothetical protein [Candidatus Eisenbacteria bacterium]
MAALVGAGLAAQALMLAAPGALPPALGVAFASAVLVLLPGYAFVALGAMPPGGAWLAPGWALGFGVAWLGFWVLVTRALHLPFTVLTWWSLVTTTALWAFVIGRRSRPSAPRGAPEERRSQDGGAATGCSEPEQDAEASVPRGATRSMSASPSVPRGAPRPMSAAMTGASLIALLLAAVVGAWHAGRLGAPLGLHTDSPDHIGTIRRMVASGDAFPRDAFFKDAGAAGADPRKGLWHAEVALIAKLAGADPLDTWRWLPTVLVPLFVLNAAALGFLLRGPPGAAVAGWALLVTYGGSLASQFLREAVFATKVGDQLALATAAAVIADLRAPDRRMRLAAVGLALGALAAHVYYAIPFAMTLTALGAGLAIADRGWSGRVARLAGTALAIGAAGLPYLLWRAGA